MYGCMCMYASVCTRVYGCACAYVNAWCIYVHGGVCVCLYISILMLPTHLISPGQIGPDLVYKLTYEQWSLSQCPWNISRWCVTPSSRSYRQRSSDYNIKNDYWPSDPKEQSHRRHSPSPYFPPTYSLSQAHQWPSAPFDTARGHLCSPFILRTDLWWVGGKLEHLVEICMATRRVCKLQTAPAVGIEPRSLELRGFFPCATMTSQSTADIMLQIMRNHERKIKHKALFRKVMISEQR